MTRLLIIVIAAAVLVLLVAQLVLPRIAASRISSRVGRYGSVESVSVRAWPAVELLWGSADSVSVRAHRLSLSPSEAAKLIWEARGVESLQFAARSVQVGPMRLGDARVHKQGSSLGAEAVIGEANVRAALPKGLAVKLVDSEGGTIRVTASGGPFGVGPAVQALAAAQEGKLVVRPGGFLLRGLTLTLFSDPHVYVEGVGASVRPGSPRSYRLTMRAHLR
ncbi:MAG TPA: LmeA family phospholipid-binding protein [Solirubrobacteraceae bacterium]|nr:LmeA family phospholipid-binding protein [Solirubrobacteraceae bacterium]